MPLLLCQPPRTTASLVVAQASCSGRHCCTPPRLPSLRVGVQHVQQQRRLVAGRAEFSRDPRGGSGGGAGGSGPATQQQQQPWAQDSYQYAPPPSSTPPPRLPPQNGGGSGGGEGPGGGGLSNLTKAFIAGAFILG